MRAVHVLLALSTLACARTQIGVTVDQDREVPGFVIDHVRLEVTPSEGGVHEVPMADQRFPLRFGIEPERSPTSEIVVAAFGFERGVPDPIVVRRRLSFIEGVSREVELVFYESCRPVDCETGETCVDGLCVSELVPCDPSVMECGDVDAGPAGDGGPGDSEVCDFVDNDDDGQVDEGLDCPQRNPLALGHDHSCRRTEDDALSCWGLNHHGRLGDQSYASSALPVSAMGTWIDVAAGSDFTCGIEADGGVSCWGANDRGQLGVADPAIDRAQVPGVEGALDIAAGDEFACAIVADGRGVECWGRDDRGQLGPRNPGSARVLGVSGAVQIAAGARHACAVLDTGEARCWGDAREGQLGGPVLSRDLPTEPAATAGRSITHLAAGDAHTCALAASGSPRVLCWGSSDDGRLGDPDPSEDLSAAEELALGRDFSCLRTETGRVFCWGANRYGTLGSDASSSSTPTPVSGITATALAAGADHVCAETMQGVRCWGYDGAGQVGRVRPLSSPPVEVMLPEGAPELVGAGDRTTCVLASVGLLDDRLYCWGEGRRSRVGELISGAPVGSVVAPTEVLSIRGASPQRRVVLGHAGRGLFHSGVGYTWGLATDGRLGHAASEHLDAPRRFPSPISRVEDLALGEHHGCLVNSADRGLYCFGRGGASELGLGSGMSDASRATPTRVGDSIDYTAVEMGRRHGCAVRRSPMGASTLHCWGDNRLGQAVGGVAARVDEPQQVTALGAEFHVATGGAHTCVGQAMTVECAGDNRRGQAGQDPAAAMLPSLMPIDGPSGFGRVSGLGAGEAFTCATTVNTGPTERVLCWGADDHGQLGRTEPGTLHLPEPVQGLPFAGTLIALAVGYDHACVIVEDPMTLERSLWCWGSSADGALGSDGALYSATPIRVGAP